MTLAQGLRLEADLSFLLQTTKDRAEGIKAFQNLLGLGVQHLAKITFFFLEQSHHKSLLELM
jgi:hypothetical protein